MVRVENVQFNVRSAFARDRVQVIAKLTGMTASEVVEDGLRGYVPPGTSANSSRLVRHGHLLVHSSSGKTITLEHTNKAIDWNRKRDIYH